jgi:hypothetical protein
MEQASPFGWGLSYCVGLARECNLLPLNTAGYHLTGPFQPRANSGIYESFSCRISEDCQLFQPAKLKDM